MSMEAKCLGIAVVTVVLCTIICYLFTLKRWIRVRAMAPLVSLLFLSTPVLKIVVKALDIDISIGNFDPTTTVVGGLAVIVTVICFYRLEMNFQKNEFNQRLFNDFRTVFISNLENDIITKEVAKRLDIDIDKANQIQTCIAWLEARLRRNDSANRP